jgi:hypothetical protein
LNVFVATDVVINSFICLSPKAVLLSDIVLGGQQIIPGTSDIAGVILYSPIK